MTVPFFSLFLIVIFFGACVSQVHGGSAGHGFSQIPSFVGGQTVVKSKAKAYGRVSKTEYLLAPEQIEAFHRDGFVSLEDVLTEEEVREIEEVFDSFLNGTIPPPPDRDFCDMSKEFGIPRKEWSIVNCMLPTKYYPPLKGNIFEEITQNIADQLFAPSEFQMTRDYDQFLCKLQGKSDACFHWHQDMSYWPGTKALGVNITQTETCTFSLAIDDSTPENGCLRYIPGSGLNKTLRNHVPLSGSREEGHALVLEVGDDEPIQLASVKRGSLTIHDEYIVHGSGGNLSPTKQRRTYVLAYRPKAVVEAERAIGFTHSHNDEVNWDTFDDGEAHRVKSSTADGGVL